MLSKVTQYFLHIVILYFSELLIYVIEIMERASWSMGNNSMGTYIVSRFADSVMDLLLICHEI